MLPKKASSQTSHLPSPPAPFLNEKTEWGRGSMAEPTLLDACPGIASSCNQSSEVICWILIVKLDILSQRKP